MISWALGLTVREFILCDPRGYSVYIHINVTQVLVEVTLSFLVRQN